MSKREVYKKLLIFGIVLNVVAILVVAVDRPETATNVSDWTSYKSKLGGFVASYPAGWSVKETEYKQGQRVDIEVKFYRTETTYMSSLIIADAAMLANLFKRHPERLQEPLLLACHKRVLSYLQRKFRRFEARDTSHGGTGPTESYVTDFTFSMRTNFMGGKMAGRVVSRWNGRKHIAVMLVCPQREYDQMLPVFDQFSKSLIAESASRPEDVLPPEDQE